MRLEMTIKSSVLLISVSHRYVYVKKHSETFDFTGVSMYNRFFIA